MLSIKKKKIDTKKQVLKYLFSLKIVGPVYHFSFSIQIQDTRYNKYLKKLPGVLCRWQEEKEKLLKIMNKEDFIMTFSDASISFYSFLCEVFSDNTLQHLPSP